jgi:hypothetical protein
MNFNPTSLMRPICLHVLETSLLLFSIPIASASGGYTNLFPGIVSGVGYANFGQNVHPVGLGPVVEARAPMVHTVARLPNGTVASWGANGYGSEVWGTLTPPANLDGVVQVDAGWGFSVALKSDGTVVAWGRNLANETQVPAGLNGVVSIDAGIGHTLALKADGTVVAWGDNSNGQATVPPGLANVRAVAAGRYNSVVLFADGTVRAWGGGYPDQLYPPPGITDVVSISSMWEHTLCLKEDGTVVAWGRNDSGQASVPVGLDRVVAVSAGAFHNLVLRDDGSVVAWGQPDDRIAVPAGVGPIVDISAGYQHSTYVVASGSVDFPLKRPTLRPVVFEGFGWPIAGSDDSGGSANSPLVSIKRGSVLPVTFTLTKGGDPVGTGVHSLSIAWVAPKGQKPKQGIPSIDLRTIGANRGTADLVPTSPVDGKYPFSYLNNGTWVVNLATQPLEKGIYQLTATLDDGSVHQAWIQVE